MAGTRTLKSSRIAIKMNYGKNEKGNDIIRSFTLQPDVVGSPDADKVIALSKVLSPCLDKEVARIEHTRVDTITEA